MNTAETVRIVALLVTMVTAIVLMIFTHATWRLFQPPVVKALMLCFNGLLFALVYGFGEALHQDAPLGARVVLSVLAVVATLAVLLVYKRLDSRRR